MILKNHLKKYLKWINKILNLNDYEKNNVAITESEEDDGFDFLTDVDNERIIVSNDTEVNTVENNKLTDSENTNNVTINDSILDHILQDGQNESVKEKEETSFITADQSIESFVSETSPDLLEKVIDLMSNTSTNESFTEEKRIESW